MARGTYKCTQIPVFLIAWCSGLKGIAQEGRLSASSPHSSYAGSAEGGVHQASFAQCMGSELRGGRGLCCDKDDDDHTDVILQADLLSA